MSKSVTAHIGKDDKGIYIMLTRVVDTTEQYWDFEGEFWNSSVVFSGVGEFHKLRITPDFERRAEELFCVSLPNPIETLEPIELEGYDQFAAVSAHLKDMRAIVSKVLDVNLPE